MTSSPPASHLCPLCARNADLLVDDAIGRFYSCPECDLRFRDPGQHLSAEDESARYREHQNSLDDPRYLAFLDRLAVPLASKLDPGARGLDYGCGPVPALASLLARRGFECASYDRLFHPDQALLTARYDFVACSEVMEHVPKPPSFLDTMQGLLRSGGLLGIMTQFHDDSRAFDTWWYRRDPTHLCFYSRATMHWIARTRRWQLELPATGIALFRVS